ncbi:DNA replication licensing factor MCM7, partial [Dichanthelium oligosanthes]
MKNPDFTAEKGTFCCGSSLQMLLELFLLLLLEGSRTFSDGALVLGVWFVSAALAKDFLSNFAGPHGEPKYLNILQDVANRKIRAVQIELDDLFHVPIPPLNNQFLFSFTKFVDARCDSGAKRFFFVIVQYKDVDEEFLQRVTENTRRYIGIFSEAMDELMPEPTEAYTVDEDRDILMTQRVDEGADGGADGTDPLQRMPPEIKRFFEVYIKAFSKVTPLTIRQVKASNIGQLVKISGIVTRCSDVKPLMQVAVYTCEECGFEIYQVKLQELAEHVPKGHIPRSLTVHLRGELTRKVAPGDVVEMSGIFLPMPYYGFRAMRAGLVADTYLEAMSVTHFKKKYEEYELKGDEQEQIDRLAEDGDIYSKLARSLAPEIFGHEDVKKALLLLLVGAPHRKLADGMKIRGDLHICLMGDPGVAKSQLLKHIINVAPRGVYTTGRGSSGVGLTAAVQKDPITSEFVLEGGALVLADMGICAIDEFDKMEESDRTAIHEVMEQQTVSIAKAGITTSLNARTAILAAANPA